MRRTFAPLAFALSLGAIALQAQSPTPLTADLTARENSRQFFRTIYGRSVAVPLQWTGNVAAGNAGDTSAAFKEAVRLRINYFRAMAGVPAAVTLNAAYNAKAQQAALMASANNQVSSNPPASWKSFSAAGAEGAANSNLALGQSGAEAVTAYMRGDGDSNAPLAYRRWLLYPWTRAMGTGDIPATGNLVAANATWVNDSAAFSGARPATREPFVAWPPSGFVPYQVVFRRWSFSYPGADFSAATVTMTRDGSTIPVRLETVADSPGENTLVWVYDNLDARVPLGHPQPGADASYDVTIAGVRGAGVPARFSYNVTVFDPEAAESFVRLPTVNGSITPALGQPNPYNFVKPEVAATFEWRTFQFTPFSTVFSAEGDLQGVNATTTGTYAVRDLSRPDAGRAAYRLAHETAEPQILLLPGSYYSALGAPAVLNFRSMLALAAATETARVQISLDDGATWRDAWTQAGSGGVGESGYSTRTVSLADYAGRTIRLRLLFTIDGNLPNGPSPVNAGWHLDDIALTSARSVNADAAVPVTNGSVFRFTPTAPGTVCVQARGVIGGAYAMEWGPVAQVVAVGADGAGDPGRLTNLAIRTLAGSAAQTLIMGMSIGGTGTVGNKPMLIRGVGPSLGSFGVTGFLADPILSLLSGPVVLTTNDNWENDSQVVAVTPQVGAFPLVAASRDAALVTARSAGSYTVQIAGAGGTTGVALAEVYDATPSGGFNSTTPRLANVSARAQVGTGGDILIGGFTIGGTTEKTLLVRAVGPTLGSFGVTGALADPKIELYSSGGRQIAANDNWAPTAMLAAVTASVGAFVLPPGSRDAVLLITLQPGSYTAQVSGVADATGVGLVEIYEVP